MALKRKRSTPAFSSTSTEATLATDPSNPASIPFFYTQSKPIEPLYHKPTWSFPTYESDGPPSQGLNSRTRKRYRDNRPDEESIYANTLARLYEAQKSQSHPEPVPSEQPIVTKPEVPQKSTLHSFWNIGPLQRPTTVPMAIDSGTKPKDDSHLRCEDCDSTLRQSDAMELDDQYLEEETACSMCRRHICDRCAVQGDRRICLGCTSRSSG